MNLENAIDAALSGEALLFAGAGFATGATNSLGKPFRRGTELAQLLAEATGVPTDTPLDDAAEEFVQQMGSDELIGVILKEFTALRVTESHVTLAKVPWLRVYTTNYDNAIEEAHRRASRPIRPVTPDKDIYQVPKTQPLCVHLNGYVGNLTRDSLYSELKLTESSYLVDSINSSPWTIMFRYDLQVARAAFFVGYSLYDLDIRRILVESDTLRAKCFFVLGDDPPPATVRRVAKFGENTGLSIASFATHIESRGEEFSPPEVTGPSLSSISEYQGTQPAISISDNDLLDLFRLGDVSDAAVSRALHSTDKYYLERTQTAKILDSIDNGLRNVVVCSDLGNGKSLFLRGLHERAVERGYRVFCVKGHAESTAREILEVARLPGKVMPTIDGYQSWLTDIRQFRMNASDQAALVLTARSTIHDLLFDDLLLSLGVDSIPEYYLDKMAEEEVDWFLETFTEYGLWGTYSGVGKAAKKRFFERSCGSEVQAILLRLLRSPDISSRFRQLLGELELRWDYNKIILSVLVLAALNHEPRFDVLIDLWGAEALNESGFRRDERVLQFVDVHHSRIVARSPITADFLLRDIANVDSVLSVLIQMARRADQGAPISTYYRSLFTDLTRYGSISQVLVGQDTPGTAIIRYYESIKNLRGAKQRPLFWLQYAIATLVVGDLDRSRRYFDTAYALAESQGWDTFQIDNHYARFMLRYAIERADVTEAFDYLRRARSILNRQFVSERLHHPFRVASTYQEFVDKFAGAMSRDQVEELRGTVSHVIEVIAALPAERQQQRYVRQCSRAMQYILERLSD